MDVRESRQEQRPFAFLCAFFTGLLVLWGIQALFLPGTALEEIQTGALGQRLLTDRHLPPEFALTNSVAAMGFALFGESLIGLRAGFILLGVLVWSLLSFILLQSAKNPAVVAAFLFAVSTSPLLPGVILHADEICFGFSVTIFSLALILAIASLSALWLIPALCFSLTMTLYEYVAYKLAAACIAVAVLAVIGSHYSRMTCRQRFLIFIASAAVSVGALYPLVSDVIQFGWNSFFFDGPRRHHNPAGAADRYAQASMALRYMRYLFGYGIYDDRLSAAGIAVMPAALSHLLFGFGVWASRRDLLARCCLVHTVVAPFFAALLAQNFEPLRMLPAFATLILAGLIGLASAPIAGGKGWRSFFFVVGGLGICLMNATNIPRLAKADEILRLHAHDDYPLCSLIASLQATGHHSVELLAFDDFADCHQEEESRWIVPNRVLVRRVVSFEGLSAAPDTPVIFAKRYGLSGQQIEHVTEWGETRGRPIHWIEDLAGRIFAGVARPIVFESE